MKVMGKTGMRARENKDKNEHGIQKKDKKQFCSLAKPETEN